MNQPAGVAPVHIPILLHDRFNDDGNGGKEISINASDVMKIEPAFERFKVSGSATGEIKTIEYLKVRCYYMKEDDDDILVCGESLGAFRQRVNEATARANPTADLIKVIQDLHKELCRQFHRTAKEERRK